ncbi:MAG: DUF2219 family protein [Yoonia sp.]|nr:DUF2219 family protein [Yoonia sp.]
MRPLIALLIALLPAATPAFSEGREVIGNGRLFTNDFFGDGRDRWRTGSYVYSHVRARDTYTGYEEFGDLLEYRLRAEIIAPATGPAPGDRPYVGAMSIGAITHFDYSGFQVSLGSELTAVGLQTGMSVFQEKFHDTLGMTGPLYPDDQIENAFYLSGTAAATRSFRVGQNTSVRPFIEGQIGAEDLVRAGADMIIGQVAQDDLLLRDVVTGQLYRATEGDGIGLSYVLGVDVASVFDSNYLPAEMGYTVSDTRTRARAGVFWQMGEDVSFFYGATYLSEEFEGQTEGQVLGSLKLNFNF